MKDNRMNFENIVTGTLPENMTRPIKKLVEKHAASMQAIQEYYTSCDTHVQFLQECVSTIRSFLLQHGIEYSQKGLASARARIMPLVEKFSEQKKKTDKAVQAILYLVMQYIEDSPFNQNILLDEAPLLAVLGVNVFLVTFSSAVIAANGIQKVFSSKTVEKVL